jgi:biopolymer transport protein ExbB
MQQIFAIRSSRQNAGDFSESEKLQVRTLQPSMKHRFFFPLIACIALVCGGTIAAIAQEAKPTDPAAPAPPETAKVVEMTLWEQIKLGGLIMIPIALCSVATFYLLVDGLIRITNKKKSIPEAHVTGVKNLFRTGDYVGAYKFCKNNPSPFTNVTRAALSMVGEGKGAVEEAAAAEISKENAQMQYYISYLSVIGVCTPMIGLLGTVFGMMSAFSTLGTSGIGDPSKLSEAIGHVLVATAAGLFIAIPAFFGYYWLRNRSAKVIHDLQDTLGSVFKKMPYEHLAGAHLGDEELYAALPNWVQPGAVEAQA